MAEVRNWMAIKCAHPGCNEEFFKGSALARHRIIDHGDRAPLSRTEIDEAVKCENWQTLRILLKGLPTAKKVAMLQGYLDGRAGGTICCTQSTRYVQVLNYLNALSRGGQIEALSNTEHGLLVLDHEIKVRIRR